ncbi:MAG TPA: adenylate/guanylate cyclase domain-containing protein [Candidatus Sulfotelmatobacter sp.]|nr:adenylate/guanylate cyclase domain-containing protein [Candidatus Sulfotelmatobacter sp.]
MRSGQVPQSLLAGGLVAAVIAFSLLAQRYLLFVAIAENFTSDWVHAAFEPYQPQHPDIVVLAITEDTLAQFPFRFPVDRNFLADTLDVLATRKVKAVGIDILFDQPTLADADARFIAAAHRFPAPLVVSWADQAAHLNDRQYAFEKKYLAGIQGGFANVLSDSGDGTVRLAFPGRAEDGVWRDSFSGALAADLGAPPNRQRFRIHYHLGPDLGTPAFREYPAQIVKSLPPAWLAGKIVLIGADLPFDDRHRTPAASVWGNQLGTVPGILIQAQMLANRLAGEELAENNLPLEVLIAALLGLAAIGIALWERAVPIQLIAAAGVIVLLWGGVAFLYWKAGVTVPLIAPSLSFAVGLFASVGYIGYRRRLQGQFVREAFSRYVSPSVVKKLEANPDQLSLGGETRDVSVLFTDIEGFTSFAEGKEPTFLLGILNRYLNTLTAEVQRFGGMVDKFIGDAIMAVFGAPDLQPDHAERALACARAMRDAAAKLQAELAEQGIRFGRTRIGVHSGSAVVGNVGGEIRFDYTAIGDVVNTASRLEGANKYFHTDICASGTTCVQAPNGSFRPIGALVVKGRQEGLPVFTTADTLPVEQVAAYKAAYALMAADAPGAAEAFVRYLDSYPDDPLAQMHLKRLRAGEKSDLIVLEGK